VILALGVLLGLSRCAFALDAALDVNQYTHTAWKNREGFARGAIGSIVQTPDGYLWLGTDFGLLRFDGVRTFPWQAPQGQSLPDLRIRCLLASRDGTLWIGTWNGLASWGAGKLVTYSQLDGVSVNSLHQDREGVVWVAAESKATSRVQLCVITNGGARCEEDESRFGKWAASLREDSKGQLWATAETGLWRLRPDSPKPQTLPALPNNGLQGLADGGSGALLIATKGGIVRLVDGTGTVLFAMPQSFRATQILRDRDGGVWVGTADRGLLHLHNGHVDAFGALDGLTGDIVTALFEDREGDIWVASLDGLDRFRDVTAATYSVRQGLSSSEVTSVLASRDGSIWIGTLDGLNRWRDGQMTVYAPRRGDSPRRASSRAVQEAAPREIGGSGLPSGTGSLFEDDRGRVWVGSHAGVGYLENYRYVANE
jgi:ligand-binding sensor domain-containing protein